MSQVLDHQGLHPPRHPLHRAPNHTLFAALEVLNLNRSVQSPVGFLDSSFSFSVSGVSAVVFEFLSLFSVAVVCISLLVSVFCLLVKTLSGLFLPVLCVCV